MWCCVMFRVNENGFARAFGGDSGTCVCRRKATTRLSPCFAGSWGFFSLLFLARRIRSFLLFLVDGRWGFVSPNRRYTLSCGRTYVKVCLLQAVKVWPLQGPNPHKFHDLGEMNCCFFFVPKSTENPTGLHCPFRERYCSASRGYLSVTDASKMIQHSSKGYEVMF
jgi:hypothetical protein